MTIRAKTLKIIIKENPSTKKEKEVKTIKIVSMPKRTKNIKEVKEANMLSKVNSQSNRKTSSKGMIEGRKIKEITETTEI